VGVVCAAALPLEAPVPVTDTEDVVKAKAEFKSLYDAAAAAAAADEVPEVIVPSGAPMAVADTDDVTAAKAKFKAAFDAAAAAAEAAPDFDLDGDISTYTGFLSGVDGRLSPYYTNTFPYGAFGYQAPVFAGAPLVAGAPLLKSSAAAGTTLIAGGAPLAYNTLGLGFPGYGYGFHGLYNPFVQFVRAEE